MCWFITISWGGYAVTAIFNYNHEITGSVSVAGFNKPMSMILEWTKGMMGNFAYIEYPYIYLYQKMLFEKNSNMLAVDGINNTTTPILIIHGNKDTTVAYNGAGTIAYRDDITNPNVEYKICDGEKQNEHSNLQKQYNENIPKEIDAEFCANVDKQKMSELDEDFMQDVLTFYDNAVKK